MAKPNRIRELLRSGKPTLGTRMLSIWPNQVEALGHSGNFDYVEFAGEYSPYTLHDLENFCRAAELYNLGTMIKVDQDTQGFAAQRAIGAGFSSILFASSRNPDEALACVQSVRAETPEAGGRNGVGLRRNCYMAYGASADYPSLLDDVVIAMMIEKKSAVDQIEAILALPGIDLIQWGGADYSLSAGRPGMAREPETKKVEREVLEACRRHGVAARAEIRTLDDAKYYLDLGLAHFSLGTDLLTLFDFWKRQGDSLRNELERRPAAAVQTTGTN